MHAKGYGSWLQWDLHSPPYKHSCHQQFSLWANWASCLDTTRLKWPLITRTKSKHPQLAFQKKKRCCKHLAAPPISPWSYPTTRHSFPFLSYCFQSVVPAAFCNEPPAQGYPQAHGWFTLLSCLSVITNHLSLCTHSPVSVTCCLYLFLKHNSQEFLLKGLWVLGDSLARHVQVTQGCERPREGSISFHIC